MNNTDESDHIKEVYARYGLALYHAQVLEHGIVNSLTILSLLPSRRHFAESQDEWGLLVDEFMDRNFEKSMGQMITALRAVTTVPDDLEGLFRQALKKRNWLVHDFFRERVKDFLDSAGRDKMLAEVDGCRAGFEEADQRLAKIVDPLRNTAGITDKMLMEEFQRLVKHRSA